MAGNINITVTEILGTDSMNNSRVTINNNFRVLAQAINTIGQLVSADEIGSTTTALKGSTLQIGNIAINSNGITIGDNTLTADHIAKLIRLFDDNQLELLNGSQEGIRINVDNAGTTLEITGDVCNCTINGNDILTESGTGE